jgi:hypothetical protein
VRSCHGGRANDKVQTTISTDIMISANIRRLPPATRQTPHAARRPPNTTRHTPPASRLPVPGICNSASLWIEHAEAYMGAYSQASLGVSCRLRVYLTKQAGSVSSSAIGSVLESVLRSVLQSVLRAYLGAYSQPGWKCAFECNWERL